MLYRIEQGLQLMTAAFLVRDIKKLSAPNPGRRCRLFSEEVEAFSGCGRRFRLGWRDRGDGF
ncbi:MAG: hypothetical protein KHY61_10160, partial [Sutterella wadsworthensis]|nr:hypothetical protein [Sutterella wadsworthensis]